MRRFALFFLLFASPISFADPAMTEKRFHELIDEVFAHHRNIILKAAPKGTEIRRDWAQDKVNGFASNIDGLAKITLKGGVARLPGITEDGFRAYFCHEIGHIIGGEPRKSQGLPIYHNLSVEGQCDYHAGKECLRRVFTGKDNVAAIAGLNVPKELRAKCTDAYPGEQDEVAMCIRIAMAGYSMISSLDEDRQGKPSSISFATPEVRRAQHTLESYGSAQCRLDTFLSGATGSARPNCWYHDRAPTKQDRELKGPPPATR
jgi:hypothetical protein